MTFKIYIQKPKAEKKHPLIGTITIMTDKTAGLTAFVFGLDDKCLAELQKPDIVFMAADGIMLRGYEPAGRLKFNYQEWWCVFNL